MNKKGNGKEMKSQRSGILSYSSAPYVRSRLTTGDLMYVAVLSLLPCAGFGMYHYGLHAALLIGISVGTAILAEFLCDWIGKKESSIWDYSCVVTGLVGGLILPPSAPLWYAALLSALAVVVFKHLFGGLGKNLFNPAMAGKFVLMILFYSSMSQYGTSEYTETPPLVMLEEGETPDLLSMLTGNVAGCIGTSSCIGVFIAAAILLVAGIIDLTIPLSAIVAFLICYLIAGQYGLSFYTQAVQLCGGSFLFTVFIMAQDYTTSPISTKARAVYGALLGILIFVFRQIGFVEDACVYALLIVNAVRPLLDKKLAPSPFGATASKWVIQEPKRRKTVNPEPSKAEEKQEKVVTNETLDAEFEKFEEKIERQTRGLETARYTGDERILRQIQAENYEDGSQSLYEEDLTQEQGEFESVVTDTAAIHPGAINAALQGEPEQNAQEKGNTSWRRNEDDETLGKTPKRNTRSSKKNRAKKEDAGSIRDTDMWEVEEILRAEREMHRENEDEFSRLQFMDFGEVSEDHSHDSDQKGDQNPNGSKDKT